mgnify:CR=1 FL=1
MATHNSVTLLGRLMEGLTIKKTSEGKVVFCRTKLVVDRKFANKKTGQNADVFPLVFFGESATLLSEKFPNLQPGQCMIVQGAAHMDRYEKKGGKTEYSFNVVGEMFNLIPIAPFKKQNKGRGAHVA